MIRSVILTEIAVRAGVETTYTNLTQPTGIAVDWAGMNYTKPEICPGGIPSGRFDLKCRMNRRCPNLFGDNMNQASDTLMFPREQIVQSLADLRNEWEQALPGENLVDVTCSLGLLLTDLSRAFGLSHEEQELVLGTAILQNTIEL